MKKNKKKLLEPSSEEKAFVCQQAMEIGPLLAQNGLGPLSVILEKNKSDKGERFQVTFILIPDRFNIKVKSQGSNLFDVCLSAKDKARKTLDIIINQMDSPLRDVKIAHFKRFPYLQ